MDAMQAIRAQRFAQGYNILTGVVRDPPTFRMISDLWVSVKLLMMIFVFVFLINK